MLQARSLYVCVLLPALVRGSSVRERTRPGMGSLQRGVSPATARQNGTVPDLAAAAPHSFSKAVLYVFGEKTQVKAIKMESFPKCDFIPIDYHEVRHVKMSFKKLMRACVPSAPFTDPEKGVLKAVEDSEWLQQIQNILLIAGAIVDLMDMQGSSVMMCLEDGWDFTTQVVSIAQILMDPFYRTVDGLHMLIEKEWLSFGHRFTHRSSQTIANQASGFAPIFLQFLDVVHQVHRQFPQAFEYNEYFLRFLAYHYVSNRFRTFMLDNEFERMEAGWLMEDGQQAQSDSQNSDSCLYVRPHVSGLSVWDYIEKYQKKSPIFYNFLYMHTDGQPVLRPYSNVSNLHVWEYYLKEDLARGPSYDFEVIQKEVRMDEDQALIEGPLVPSLRRVLNAAYDNVEQAQPDAFTYLLQEIQRICHELEETGPRWRLLWEKLDQPHREEAMLNDLRSHSNQLHSRLTVELLGKGKMLGDAARMFSQPHHFEKFNYSTPAYCDYCSHVLWGLVKTGMRCSECGYNSHEKCVPHVPKNCTKLRPVSEASVSSSNLTSEDIVEVAAVSAEHCTYKGYLYKRGALLKGWKQRWFVLDSMKHQLRYYDSAEDLACKGFIDLADVVSVVAIKNVQGAPKKSDDSAFFEMKTVRRTYNFLAPDGTAAHDWIDRIQSCIQ